MDYEKIEKEYDAMNMKMNDKLLSAIKDYMINNGIKRNPFINKLSMDVSDWCIEFNGNSDCTIDYIEYIVDTDKLQYLILNENGSAFRNETITHEDSLLIKYLFHIFCKCKYIKKDE